MLSVDQNQKMTEVSAGTAMGGLLRRYWFPIAAKVELDEQPTKAVRVLGEDLVLYKDKSGTLGLIGKACPHRRVSLEYGIPEEHGLRCPYHGWLWNEQGRCLEQPAEPAESNYKDEVRNSAYAVQEMGGLVFAYLGPKPVPCLPGWDLLVRDDLVKEIVVQVLNCNWVQVMENSVDPYHTEYLHARQTLYHQERMGRDVAKAPGGASMLRHTKIGFDLYERGIIKRRVLEGQTEDSDAWRIGHPVLFPNILKVGSHGRYNMQFRVPVDETHTYHVAYVTELPRDGKVPTLNSAVPVREAQPFDSEKKRFKVANNKDLAQDAMAWVTAGEIMDRSQEHLGVSDRGVVLFRKLLQDQLHIVEDGGEPMNVFRDSAEAEYVHIQTEEDKYSAVVAGSGQKVQFGAFGIFESIHRSERKTDKVSGE